MRRPYEASFEALCKAVPVVGEPSPRVLRRPTEDDDEPGPSIYWETVEDVRLENLTLPGLFVGRAGLRRVSFAGSDLRLATFSRSQVSDCSFVACDLSGADLRGCAFSRCSFRDADLSRADLRSSSFDRCDFSGARLDGAVLFRRSGWFWRLTRSALPFAWAAPDQAGVPLSDEQRAQVYWNDHPAPPVSGGPLRR